MDRIWAWLWRAIRSFLRPAPTPDPATAINAKAAETSAKIAQAEADAPSDAAGLRAALKKDEF